MLSFAGKVIAPSKKLIPNWMLIEHRCPLCNGVVVDLMEIKFMEHSGRCATCDDMYQEYNEYEEVEPEERDGEDPRYEYLADREQE